MGLIMQDIERTPVELDTEEFPPLPSRTPVAIWETECWVEACDQRMTLWFVGPNGLWSMHRLEAHPLVLEAVRRHTAGDGVERHGDAAPLATLAEVFTRPAGMYLGFCCPRCGMVQGDFFNTKEMIALAKQGLVEKTYTQ